MSSIPPTVSILGHSAPNLDVVQEYVVAGDIQTHSLIKHKYILYILCSETDKLLTTGPQEYQDIDWVMYKGNF
jgi:hypothetical protein